MGGGGPFQEGPIGPCLVTTSHPASYCCGSASSSGPKGHNPTSFQTALNLVAILLPAKATKLATLLKWAPSGHCSPTVGPDSSPSEG